MAASPTITIHGKSASAQKAIGDVRGKLSQLDKHLDSTTGRWSRFGGIASKTGKVAGLGLAAGVGVAVVGLKKAVDAAADFERSLNSFSAVTKATGDEMGRVSQLSKDLGRDISIPGASAADAAKAMTELAKGGLSVRDSMDAAKSTLQLAAAAEVDNARAATIVADALNTFALKGRDAGKVADLLAGAANASTGEINDMAMALAQGGAQANTLKIPIGDTVTAISALANAGIKGSDAGTSLKTMLQRLVPQTKDAAAKMHELGVDAFDANGKFVGLESVVGQYHRALKPLSQEQRQLAIQTIFGSDASRAASIIFGKSAKTFDDLRDKVSRAGQAQDIAAAKMKGFKGAVEALKSSAETLAITVGTPLLSFGTRVATAVSGAVGWLDKLAAKMDRAKGFSAKVRIVWEGVQDLAGVVARGVARVGGNIGRSIGQAIERAGGWRQVGQRIGAAIGNAIELGTDAASRMVGSLVSALSARRGQIAEAGASLAVALVAKLTDPAFWARHWRELAAIGATLFGGGLVRGIGAVFPRLTGIITTGAVRLGRALSTGLISRLTSLPGVLGNLFQRFFTNPAISRMAGGLATRIVNVFRGPLGGIPGLLKKAFALTAIVTFVRGAISQIGNLVGRVRETMGNVKSTITNAVKGIPGAVRDMAVRIGKAILGGILDGLKNLPGALKSKITGALGGAVGGIKGLAGSIGGKIGDGLVSAVDAGSFGLYPVGQFKGAQAGATGLQASIRDELALGNSMGLRLTSGVRPPNRTSSGGWSLHSSGRAIDMAGSHAQMAAFARRVAGRPGIREVLYSPVGGWYPGSRGFVPIRNPQTRADHYDHVHVGTGDGLVGAGDKMGDAYGTRYTPRQLAEALKQAGFTGANLVRMIAIALAESGGSNIRGRADKDDRGPWQINRRYWPGIKDAQAFSLRGGATGAAQVFRQQGLGAWVTYNRGMHQKYMAAAQAAANSLGDGVATAVTNTAKRVAKRVATGIKAKVAKGQPNAEPTFSGAFRTDTVNRLLGLGNTVRVRRPVQVIDKRDEQTLRGQVQRLVNIVKGLGPNASGALRRGVSQIRGLLRGIVTPAEGNRIAAIMKDVWPKIASAKDVSGVRARFASVQQMIARLPARLRAGLGGISGVGRLLAARLLTPAQIATIGNRLDDLIELVQAKLETLQGEVDEAMSGMDSSFGRFGGMIDTAWDRQTQDIIANDPELAGIDAQIEAIQKRKFSGGKAVKGAAQLALEAYQKGARSGGKAGGAATPASVGAAVKQEGVAVGDAIGDGLVGTAAAIGPAAEAGAKAIVEALKTPSELALEALKDWKSPARIALEAFEEEQEDTDVARAIEDAQAKLDAALYLGDPAMIKEAQRELADAQRAARREQLEDQADAEESAHEKLVEGLEAAAAIEREALDKRIEAQKEAQEAITGAAEAGGESYVDAVESSYDEAEDTQLAALQAAAEAEEEANAASLAAQEEAWNEANQAEIEQLQKIRAHKEREISDRRDLTKAAMDAEIQEVMAGIAKGEITQEEGMKRILGILRKYELDYENLGSIIGNAFAKGMADAFGAFAAAVDKYLEKRSELEKAQGGATAAGGTNAQAGTGTTRGGHQADDDVGQDDLPPLLRQYGTPEMRRAWLDQIAPDKVRSKNLADYVWDPKRGWIQHSGRGPDGKIIAPPDLPKFQHGGTPSPFVGRPFEKLPGAWTDSQVVRVSPDELILNRAQKLHTASRLAERDVLMEAAGRGGGGDVYNVDVHVAGNAIYERDLATTIQRTLQKKGAQGGRLGLA